MTPLERRFCEEYPIDLNVAKAATRAGYSAKTAYSSGQRAFCKPEIKAEIERLLAERSRRTAIDTDQVLRHWVDIAHADPNDIIEYRRGACRYCHGRDHIYQWCDHVEYAEALAKAAKSSRSRKSALNDDGGYGYRHNAAPDPDCPRCCGDGRGYSFVHPSRDVPARSRVLYAGVKEGRDGLEVKLHDSEAVWDKVAKHLGMFKERVEHSGKVTLAHLTDEDLDAQIAAYEQGSHGDAAE